MSITRGKNRHVSLCARVTIAAFACIFSCSAPATPPLSVQRYSLEEGLSQQAVNTIVQDSEGFMWFGTEDGLNRFDGYEFRQLRHERGDEETLPNGWISSLVATEDGLWIGTVGGGVVFRNAQTGKLSAPAQLARRSGPAARTHDGARPARPPVDRLARCRCRDLRCAHRRIASPALLADRRRIRFPTIPSSASSICATATRCSVPRAGSIVSPPPTSTFHGSPLPPELVPHGQPLRVRALTESPDGMVWVGTDAGLGRFDPRSDRWRVYRQSPGQPSANSTGLPDNRVQSLLIDSQGRLWVGLIDGLSWFDSATETFSSYHRDESEPRSLPDDYVQSLFEDRGGSLWIGTKSGGLAKWNPRTWSFGHFRASAEEGFTDRNITSFAEDKLGRSVDRHLRQRHQPARSRHQPRDARAPRERRAQ